MNRRRIVLTVALAALVFAVGGCDTTAAPHPEKGLVFPSACAAPKKWPAGGFQGSGAPTMGYYSGEAAVQKPFSHSSFAKARKHKH